MAKNISLNQKTVETVKSQYSVLGFVLHQQCLSAAHVCWEKRAERQPNSKRKRKMKEFKQNLLSDPIYSVPSRCTWITLSCSLVFGSADPLWENEEGTAKLNHTFFLMLNSWNNATDKRWCFKNNTRDSELLKLSNDSEFCWLRSMALLQQRMSPPK